jgi:hypothetical protein
MIFRRCALVLGMAPCLYPCTTTSSLNAALPFDQRPQSVRAFAGHSQFANIKVHTQRNNMPSPYESHTFDFLSTRKLPKMRSVPSKIPSTLRLFAKNAAPQRPRTLAAVYVVILPLVCVIPASQMLRACSYEVAGDMTSPRLASLIERARTASVPKVSHQHASHPPFALHYFTIQTEILREFLWIVCRQLLSAQ